MDNLEKGHRAAVSKNERFVEGDLRDKRLLRSLFKKDGTEAVIHPAAYSLVGESVQNPSRYYQNNVCSGLIPFDAMIEADVKKIVFSSTAAVCGEAENQPIPETDRHAFRPILMERRSSPLKTRFVGMKKPAG